MASERDDRRPSAGQLSMAHAGHGSRSDQDHETTSSPRVVLPRVEKDVDDTSRSPTSSRGLDRRRSTTLTTLSRLFAVQAAVSPNLSRNPSDMARSHQKSSFDQREGLVMDSAALSDHLFTRGLLDGRHSDITLHAFGHPYKLHRLMLDRAPFFAGALNATWRESTASEMSVHPECIDAAITQNAFELALKRLYGCRDVAGEEKGAVGLFATASWLEMEDLIDSAVASILRQMTPRSLAPLIRMVTANYYGRAGDKILASAKSLLCRDGWKMPVCFWDGVPGDVVREIVGGDGFYVDGEWERWLLTKRILNRRLKAQALKEGLVEHGNKNVILRAPDNLQLVAIRFDAVYRHNAGGLEGVSPDSLRRWIACYTHPEVEPLLVLIDEGIHYVHLEFEQLQVIRSARDCFGLPVMAERTISNALWSQMELRQRIVNARDCDLELGLSIECDNDNSDDGGGQLFTTIAGAQKSPSEEGIARVGTEQQNTSSGSWDGNGKPRKFWIPSSDCNIIMGGDADPIIATTGVTTIQRHASRTSSANLQPEDVQWVTDFSSATSASSQARFVRAGSGEDPRLGLPPPISMHYTHLPPFRFSAEFPSARFLKEKKRVYSRTVFYAGSLWNIYIQKVASSRSKQLGVYLHRAKEREGEDVAAGLVGGGSGSSVGERISAMERGSRLRRSTRDEVDADDADSSESAGDHDSAFIAGDAAGSRRGGKSRMSVPSLSHRSRHYPDPLFGTNDDSLLESDSEDDDDKAFEQQHLAATSQRYPLPATPAYVDARPTIKTYFKIYSPSRGGRMLSVYESAPDRFNFSQSWGWKSSNLMLDEGFQDEAFGIPEETGDDERDQTESHAAGLGSTTTSSRSDGKLRFMVVIGNI